MKNKGFTLIEVLIVVVIIAVLASLILPRMTAQIKRAESAEAMQMIGVMRRAAEYMRSFGREGFIAAGPGPFGPTDKEADWANVGLKKPNSSKWTYVLVYANAPGTVYDDLYAFYGNPVTDSNVSMQYLNNPGTKVGYICHGMNYIFDPKYPNDESHAIGCTLA
ncbi:MAG TPA: prepilin-type N-terminal cleavage/methylation domain-containing protein [Candidatus Omnitrophota bacterium]|nr:prepilin-type N-terminal cleavage/methylation domain-containing protein [Candidatus Omnitrophota bacterium]HPS37201.1 prepilin-type N-terminal cleavage/methylation domain-containing protein [Candidatus Omnitrophota bacterium]